MRADLRCVGASQVDIVGLVHQAELSAPAAESTHRNSRLRPMKQHPAALAILLVCSACATSPRPTRAIGGDTLGLEKPRLPTGVRLDPVGTQHDLRAAMPLTMVLAPGGRSLVISSAGYREPGLDVVDRS